MTRMSTSYAVGDDARRGPGTPAKRDGVGDRADVALVELAALVRDAQDELLRVEGRGGPTSASRRRRRKKKKTHGCVLAYRFAKKARVLRATYERCR